MGYKVATLLRYHKVVREVLLGNREILVEPEAPEELDQLDKMGLYGRVSVDITNTELMSHLKQGIKEGRYKREDLVRWLKWPPVRREIAEEVMYSSHLFRDIEDEVVKYEDCRSFWVAHHERIGCDEIITKALPYLTTKQKVRVMKRPSKMFYKVLNAAREEELEEILIAAIVYDMDQTWLSNEGFSVATDRYSMVRELLLALAERPSPLGAYAVRLLKGKDQLQYLNDPDPLKRAAVAFCHEVNHDEHPLVLAARVFRGDEESARKLLGVDDPLPLLYITGAKKALSS